MGMMKNYWKPTPKRWRKIGDALLATSTVITVGGFKKGLFVAVLTIVQCQKRNKKRIF